MLAARKMISASEIWLGSPLPSCSTRVSIQSEENDRPGPSHTSDPVTAYDFCWNDWPSPCHSPESIIQSGFGLGWNSSSNTTQVATSFHGSHASPSRSRSESPCSLFGSNGQSSFSLVTPSPSRSALGSTNPG